MITIIITQSGLDWSERVPIGPDITKAEYDALPSSTLFTGTGYTVYFGEHSAGFSYADIVGKTINELRESFLEGPSYEVPVTVRAQGTGDFLILPSINTDYLVGGDGNDTLVGNGSYEGEGLVDILYGGAGEDTYIVDTFDAKVSEHVFGDWTTDAGGNDTIIFSSPAYSLEYGEHIENIILGDGAQYLSANEFANNITGNGGLNVLRGEGGDDVITSRGGDVLLEGGDGNDRLIGGSGADIFLYTSGQDRIEQFGRNDVLLTRTPIHDSNDDGIIGFGRNNMLDFAGGGTARITSDTGAAIKALEFDGFFEDTVYRTGLFYVYSQVGSSINVESVNWDLITYEPYWG